MEIYLKELSANDDKLMYDMLQGIELHDNGFENPVKDMPYDTYLLW